MGDNFAFFLLLCLPIEVIADTSKIVFKVEFSIKNFTVGDHTVKNEYCIVVEKTSLLIFVSFFELSELLWNINLFCLETTE